MNKTEEGEKYISGSKLNIDNFIGVKQLKYKLYPVKIFITLL